MSELWRGGCAVELSGVEVDRMRAGGIGRDGEGLI
jgi:hypothetical protein